MALGTIKWDFFWSFWGVCRSFSPLCRTRRKPPGWHLKVSRKRGKKGLNLQPYLGRSPSVSSEADILCDSLRSTVSERNFSFYAQSGRLCSGTFRSLKWRSRPGRTFRPSCSSSAQFDFRVFLLLQTSLMSLGVFFLIQKYAFQETELSRLRAAWLRPQRPLVSASRKTPRKRGSRSNKVEHFFCLFIPKATHKQ